MLKALRFKRQTSILLYIFTMKSITIKGSESVGKVATKALRNAERFLALYTEEINQFIFQQKQKSVQRLVYTQTHSCDINGKSFDAFTRHPGSPGTDNILHIDFFQILTTKKSLLKFQ
jgi:hypothetical protein